MLELTTQDDAVLVKVKVVPGASRTRVQGIWDGRLKVAVAAPPERGRANKALLKLLAGLLGVRTGDLDVVTGHTSPLKTVRIRQLSEDDVRTRLKPDS